MTTMTLAQVIALQDERNRLYQEACDESRMVSSNARHDDRQQSTHTERSRPIVGGYEQDRLGETWARYYAFCAEVDAAKRALRASGEITK